MRWNADNSTTALGPIVLPADPIVALQAATKQYVDSKGGGGVWIGDTAPVDTTKYPFWWSSASLQLAIWYNDGNSSQWVDTNAQQDGAYGALAVAGWHGGDSGLAWASEPGLGWYPDCCESDRCALPFIRIVGRAVAIRMLAGRRYSFTPEPMGLHRQRFPISQSDQLITTSW